jgi:hypothetical protein
MDMIRTMTLSSILMRGFAHANQRLGAILLDIAWKIVWLGITGLGFLTVLIWINAEIGSIEITGAAPALNNPVALAILGRELWNAYAATVLSVIAGVLLTSTILWIILEAYFRAGLLPASDESFTQSASRYFRLFLASTVAKAITATSVFVLFAVIVFGRFVRTPVAEWNTLWRDTRGSFAVALAISIVLWFAMTLLETLIRSESMELLGRELFIVVGLFAILTTIEGFVLAILLGLILLVSGFLSGLSGLLIMAAVLVLSAGALSAVRSYLLIVRYSSLAVLRLDLEGITFCASPAAIYNPAQR